MPFRPLTLPFRIGTDIVSINRIKRAISDGTKGDEMRLRRFINRILTPAERNNLQRRYPNVEEVLAEGLPMIAQYLAGRFAAKEAVMKAFPARKLAFRDIEIRRGPMIGERSGAPYAVVFDQAYFSTPKSADAEKSPAAEEDAPREKRDLDAQKVQISISHDGDYATAVCIAPDEPMPGDVGGEAAARED